MKMLSSIVALAAIASIGAASAASAADDVVAQRQAILKGFGSATMGPGGMLQGKAPFDLAKVQAALATYQKGATVLPALFTPGTQMGAPGVTKNEALPAIWTKKADFDARFVKLGADSKAASAAIKDEASFKANFPKILANCGGCHETYKAKK